MSSETNKFGRKSYVDVLHKGLDYVNKRRNGEIKSLRTPWPSFNDAGIGGLEWGSMLTIGARPGSGKTMIVSQILRDAHRLNPDQKFNILEFQFEMGDEQYAARQFAGEMAEDYGVVLSKNKRLEDFKVDMLNAYIEQCKLLNSKGIRRELISQALTHTEMREAIIEFYIEGGRKPLIVTIDHSWLIKKGSGEKDKFDVLYNTTEMLMKLKNEIPIIVIMVTQLNRSIDEPSRKTPASLSNYPTSSDIFGGDALMQGSDMVVILFRPFKSDIKLYGQYAYQVNPDDVFMHLIKMRNSDDNKKNIIFLKMEGKNQRMVEVKEPVAERPDGSYLPYTQRTGSRTKVSTSLGSDIQECKI